MVQKIEDVAYKIQWKPKGNTYVYHVDMRVRTHQNGIKQTHEKLKSRMIEYVNSGIICLWQQKYSTSHTHGLGGAIAVE